MQSLLLLLHYSVCKRKVRSKLIGRFNCWSHPIIWKGYKGKLFWQECNLSPHLDKDINLHLCDAVEAVCAINGIERVRLRLLGPEQLSEDVIIRLSNNKNFVTNFICVIAKRLWWNFKTYESSLRQRNTRTIVQNLRNAFDNAAITTPTLW